MFVVDTNILVYAADFGSPFHDSCRLLLDAWRKESAAWYTTWSVQYEFLRVVTHARAMRRPWSLQRAWRFLESLHATPGFSVLTATDRHPDVASRTFTEVAGLQGNALHDAHIAILMREHGIRTIYTRDTSFHRFPFIEVVDPLSGVHERRGPRARRLPAPR